ncbi:MAG: NAD-dependent epimerase/dehydratase family protein [Hyphomicrobiales bacterium]
MTGGGHILITGAAGRIGRLLMERLPEEGWTTRGCDISAGCDIVAADITDLKSMVAVCAGAQTVIHLAATPNAKPGWRTVNRLNIDGTKTVLEAARQAGVQRFLFASSIHTVGGYPADTPLGPDMHPNPSGLYGISKIAGEALLRLYAAQTDMACVAIRICSFRPKPENRRELKTWLSYDDCVRLFSSCLSTPMEGYQMIWGVSANTGLFIDDPTARACGYHPRDDAYAYAQSVVQSGADWPFIGGPVNRSALT